MRRLARRLDDNACEVESLGKLAGLRQFLDFSADDLLEVGEDVHVTLGRAWIFCRPLPYRMTPGASNGEMLPLWHFPRSRSLVLALWALRCPVKPLSLRSAPTSREKSLQ